MMRHILVLTLVAGIGLFGQVAKSESLGILFSVQFKSQQFDFTLTDKAAFIDQCKDKFQKEYPQGTNEFYFTIKTSFLLLGTTVNNSIQSSAVMNYSYPCDQIFAQAAKTEQGLLNSVITK